MYKFILFLLVSLLFANQQQFPFDAEIKKIIEEREIAKKKGIELVKQNKLIKRAVNKQQEIELLGIINDHPVYFTTNNVGGALTQKTYRLYPNGGRGLSFTGQGYNNIAIWDGGKVRTTHQEFQGRVTQGDAATILSDHATHVSGTITAGGVQANAKGMAYQATIKAFDWDDDITEMTQQAQQGLELSNHSYGYLVGWYYGDLGNGTAWYWLGHTQISTTEDYQFGYYSNASKSVDQIAYNYPYYLIVKAAGNDRGEGPNSGTSHYYWNYSTSQWTSSTATRNKDGNANGYDCLEGYSIAKNVLTVGAVSQVDFYTSPSSVTMSSFSCWGPTDDGRIKPDIVAKGVSVYSCVSSDNNAYATYNGTSMATPTVTGSLVLLQQYYKSIYTNPMKSATLKALVIHTADECGPNPGPDYMYGWGLLNVDKAAQVIKKSTLNNNVIQEKTLTQNQQYTFTVTANGYEPLKVTLCWVDPAAEPLTLTTASLNKRDKRLINDLDLEVTYGATTYFPWKLDPDNPSAAATNNTKNGVDNVEVIEITNPVPGATYTIKVKHVGTLSGGSQNYSLIVTGMQFPDKIFVDGVNSDWLGTLPANIHATTYSTGQFIYKGNNNDERTDYNSTQASSNNDLNEFRVATDGTYLYLFVKMRDITNVNYPHLCFVFTNGTSNQNFIGDDSKSSNTNASTATPLGSSQQYGILMDIHTAENNKPTIELYNGGNWYAPPSGDFEVWIDPTTDNIEAKIKLSDLGLTASSTTKISSMTAANRVGWNNTTDATAWGTDNQTNGIDVMTPNAAVDNAWGRDLSDGDVDYFAEINLALAPLPVELALFEGFTVDKSIQLIWKTETEINNDYFELEKLIDNNWKTIAKIKGMNNSNTEIEYNYTDKVPIIGKNFYRLKQVDNYGKFSYSNQIEVEFNNITRFELLGNYPNPFNPITIISFTMPKTGNAVVKVYNSLGQEVVTLYDGQVEAGIKQVQFNANSLTSGIYYYTVKTDYGIKTAKMILVK